MKKQRSVPVFLAACLLILCGIAGGETLGAIDKGGDLVELPIDGGLLQLRAYAEDIIRVRFAPEGVFREKSLNTFTGPSLKEDFRDYSVDDEGGTLTLTTAKLKAVVDKESGQVAFYDLSGELIVSEAGRSARQTDVGDGQAWYRVSQGFRSEPEEALYGFGNVNEVVGIKGEEVVIEQHNVRKRTPMFVSNQGYGVLFDLSSNGLLSWTEDGGIYLYSAAAADSMDYYFLYGPEADGVIAGYRKVTGTATMLPKNAFGYVQSRNRYGSQTELMQIAREFRERGIPLDTIVIDYFWWQGEFNNIQYWNQSQWPDPVQMMDFLHELNVSASISVWPSFSDKTPTYQNILDALPGFFVSGSPSGFMNGYSYDPSSKENRDYYWQLINDNVFSKGLDSIWLDAVEPEVSGWVSQGGAKIAFGDSRPLGIIYSLLTNQGVYEGQRALEGNGKRVNSLSRNAVAGIQRYGAQSWSGDIQSTWASYASEIAGVINFSAAGLPYFSTDTGGYFPLNTTTPENRELFLRWLQFSTFCSIMRVHGEGSPREPWAFGSEYEPYLVDYLKLRERLIPYIYALAGMVTQEDYTIVRPLAFNFPDDPKAAHIRDQYMFGSAFLVAPVTEYGAREREVYLPAGRWVDFWTGLTTVSKGESFTVEAPLTQIPLFIRAGSILPMGPHIEYATQSANPIELRVYPGADASFTLYEDEGDGYGYEEGAFSLIPIVWDEETKTLTLGKREGSYPGMLESRSFDIVFVGCRYGTGLALSPGYQTTVKYDGSAQTVAYDPAWVTPADPPIPPDMDTPEPIPLPKTPARALVGRWLESDREGILIRDGSGYANNGEFIKNNSSDFYEGRDGSSAAYLRGESYIAVKDHPTLAISGGVSAAVWIWHEPSGYGNIFNKGGNGSNNPGFSLIMDGSFPQVELQTAADEGGVTRKITVKASKAVPSREWVHLAFTWQSPAEGGDGYVRIYCNGELITPEDQSVFFSGPIGVNTNELRLGCTDESEFAQYPNFYRGLLNEACLFSYGLSGQEIQSLYQGSVTVLPNAENLKAAPGDGCVTVSWDIAADTEGVAAMRLSLETMEGTEEQSIMIPFAGTSYTHTLEALENGTYYNITLVCVMEDGSESSGVSAVGMANPYPAAFHCVYTPDENVYGWIVNQSYETLEGTITVEILDASGNVTDSAALTGFLVEPLEMKPFSLGLGGYQEGQSIRITYTGTEKLCAGYETPRTLYTGSADDLNKAQLLREVETPVQGESFSPESYQSYLNAMYAARAVLNTKNAAKEDIEKARNDLANAVSALSSTNTAGQGSGEEASEAPEKRNSTALLVGLAAGLAVLGGGAALWFVRKKKKGI